MSNPAKACPVCQSPAIVLTATMKHGREVDMYRCTTCGTQFSVEREPVPRTH
jgi:transposase-like protein